MKFLYPQFLWALFAIAIPIIIHLFNFRRFKRIYFSNVALLKQVDLETKKSSKIRHLLVLLARILAIICLVLAFAQPYFPEKEEVQTAGKQQVSLYLDNSFSMNATTPDGEMIYLAKKQAEEIVNQFKPSDEFQLLTNDFEGKHQRFVSREEFLELLEEVQFSPYPRDLKEVYQKQKDLFKRNTNGNSNFFWLSDFQKSNLEESSWKVDSSDRVKAIQFKSNNNTNVYIDSVWFESPIRQINKEEKAQIRLVNQSDENLQVRLELQINGETKGFNNVTIEAGQEIETFLSFIERSTGVKHVKVEISDYPDPNVYFDDEYYFSYLLAKESYVLRIKGGDAKNYISQLFLNDPFFKLEESSINQVNYGELSKYNFVFLDGVNEVSSGLRAELLKFVEAGGSIAFFPGNDIKKESVNEFLLQFNIGQFTGKKEESIKVGKINMSSTHYQKVFEKNPENIDLPLVSSYYIINESSNSKSEELLGLKNGAAFLSKFTYGSGSAYVSVSPLDETKTNFPKHAIFVPTILRMVELSGADYPLAYPLSNAPITINDNNYQLEKLSVRDKDNTFSFIPETQRGRGDVSLFINDQVNKAGNFELVYQDETIFAFGLNYNRKESDLSIYSANDLEDKLTEIGASLLTIYSNSDIIKGSIEVGNDKWWRWFIWLTLFFILTEILLIRFLK